MSSTEIVVELTVVVVPLTVKSPVTVRAFRTVVVPVVAPIVSAVAAPAKLTVVAVVFTSANVVAPVERLARVVAPETVNPVSVPTLVRLDDTSPAGSVVPVMPLAATVLADATLPVHVNLLSRARIALLMTVPQPELPFAGSGVTPSISNVIFCLRFY
jgi:hypothetical protein